MRNKLTVLIIRDRFIVVVVTVRMYYISLYTVLLLLLFGSRKEEKTFFCLFVLCFLTILHCITNYYQFIIIVNEI